MLKCLQATQHAQGGHRITQLRKLFSDWQFFQLFIQILVKYSLSQIDQIYQNSKLEAAVQPISEILFSYSLLTVFRFRNSIKHKLYIYRYTSFLSQGGRQSSAFINTDALPCNHTTEPSLHSTSSLLPPRTVTNTAQCHQFITMCMVSKWDTSHPSRCYNPLVPGHSYQGWRLSHGWDSSPQKG